MIKIIQKIDFDGSLIILIENSVKVNDSEKSAENIFVS